MKTKGAPPLPHVIRIAREAALGLAAAHAMGLVHRDIKLANLWLEAPNGRVKVLDFGLAKPVGSEAELTRSGAVVGTPAYMSPEQASGLKVDHRTDLFSLGSVLYRLCTGKTPFAGPNVMAVLMALGSREPTPVRELNPNVPVSLAQLIHQLLAKKPEDRPQIAGVVVVSQMGKKGDPGAKGPEPKTPGAAKGKADPKVPTVPAGPLPPTYTNSIGMEFVKVPKGTGWLGGGGGKQGEKKVEFKDDFYLGKYEVTQGEWEAITGLTPSAFKRGNDAVKDISDAELKRFPVESVSWDDCQEFIKKLNEREKESGWVYRLPTEAEWEFVCRGSPVDKPTSAFDFYFAKPTNTLLPEQANFGNNLKRTCKVGSYEPNLLGLNDMHGNVREWCDDAATGGDEASLRVRRGGLWGDDSGVCRAADRDTFLPSAWSRHLGLRLARVPSAPAGKVSGADPKPDVPGTFTNCIGMKFVPVPKGTGWLGGGADKEGATKVEFKEDFYLGKYEVTQAEWEAVMGSNPSTFKRGNVAVKDIGDADLKRFPVETVSWDDCQVFIKKLNEREKESGWVYRLPTGSEWEYACRGGPVDKPTSAFDFYFGKPTNTLLPEQANFDFKTDKALKRPCQVGSYEPNLLGLHDMHGNIHEWCEDAPTGGDVASRRVTRGGDWNRDSGDCRAAYRSTGAPSFRYINLGLRLARVPSVPVGK